MNILILGGALIAVVYGLFTLFRPKVPLFYKIVVYGFCSYLLAVGYSLLYKILMPDAAGFHAGYFGYAGLFFFLFSSYYGALDRLADGGETKYKKYRLAPLIPAGVIIAAGVGRIAAEGLSYSNLLKLLFLIPVSGTAYFACKHLIMPDVEMGIIRVMRMYNAVILLLCLIQPWSMVTVMETGQIPAAAGINTVLVILALPLANRGYHKWFT